MNTKSAFIAIIGETNAGKSTLLNKLIGAKVSIISHKVQTTRRKILGIYTKDDTQLVFIDTPGIFGAKKRLEKAMVRAAWDGAYDGDQVILIVDAVKKDLSNSLHAAQKLSTFEKPKMLVLNKIDLLPKEKLLEIIAKFSVFNFDDIFMISALNGDGVDRFMGSLCAKVPLGPWFYMEDQISDLSQRSSAEEITREKIYEYLHQELPYSIHVVTDRFEVFDNGDIKIVQSIVVERESQRAIVLGDRGAKIKMIGTASRKELEHFLDAKIHLFLHVVVDEKWQNRRSYYEGQGLDFED